MANKLEIYETNKRGVFACPVAGLKQLKANHCEIIKVGRKWVYFKSTAKTVPSNFNMVMPFSFMFGFNLSEVNNVEA